MWQKWWMPVADLTCKTFHIIGHAPFQPASASWMQTVQQRILKSIQWIEPLMDSAASQDHQLNHSLHPYMKLCSTFDWTKPVMLGVIFSSPYSTQKVNKLSRYNIKSAKVQYSHQIRPGYTALVPGEAESLSLTIPKQHFFLFDPSITLVLALSHPHFERGLWSDVVLRPFPRLAFSRFVSSRWKHLVCLASALQQR